MGARSRSRLGFSSSSRRDFPRRKARAHSRFAWREGLGTRRIKLEQQDGLFPNEKNSTYRTGFGWHQRWQGSSGSACSFQRHWAWPERFLFCWRHCSRLWRCRSGGYKRNRYVSICEEERRCQGTTILGSKFGPQAVHLEVQVIESTVDVLSEGANLIQYSCSVVESRNVVTAAEILSDYQAASLHRLKVWRNFFSHCRKWKTDVGNAKYLMRSRGAEFSG